MTDREKLVEIIDTASQGYAENLMQPYGAEVLADYMIANGVKVLPWISVECRLPEEPGKERWPSPVVRRHVDALLAHCPRAKEIPPVTCGQCKHSRPMPEGRNKHGYNLLLCVIDPADTLRSVWADSTCDDAEERGE